MTSKIGEISANLTGLLATQQGVTTPFKIHSDTAPTVYITDNPARDASLSRSFERATDKLTATNPITGKVDKITHFLTDPVEMQLLHMMTADPARTPTFTLFADPNYFMFAGAPNCTSPCLSENPGFAWNHGDVSKDINTTWLGLVGPGVKNEGIDKETWADHTDTRPTLLELVGLKDDYRHDGRVLFEVLKPSALPPVVQDNQAFYTELAQIYKQINAPVGVLGLNTLRISTKALASDSPNDATYTKLENLLSEITNQRNAIAGQIIKILEEVITPSPKVRRLLPDLHRGVVIPTQVYSKRHYDRGQPSADSKDK